MTDKAEIRRAVVGDVAHLLPLVESYWRFEGVEGFDGPRVVRLLARLFAEPHLGAGWIATIGGAPGGYLLAMYVFSLEHGGLTAEIDEFFIAEGRRGQGTGQSLLAAADAECIRAGCTNVSLQLGRGNAKARAFYEAHGFAPRAGYELLDKML